MHMQLAMPAGWLSCWVQLLMQADLYNILHSLQIRCYQLLDCRHYFSSIGLHILKHIMHFTRFLPHCLQLASPLQGANIPCGPCRTLHVIAA